MDETAPNARNTSATSATGGASSGPYTAVSASRTAVRRRINTDRDRTSPARGASAWVSAYSIVSPTPSPHEPCRPVPRRRSRTRLAARCHGVASRASSSTLSRWYGFPRAAASVASASGSTTMNRDR